MTTYTPKTTQQIREAKMPYSATNLFPHDLLADLQHCEACLREALDEIERLKAELAAKPYQRDPRDLPYTLTEEQPTTPAPQGD
jgi:hypothetical protein